MQYIGMTVYTTQNMIKELLDLFVDHLVPTHTEIQQMLMNIHNEDHYHTVQNGK